MDFSQADFEGYIVGVGGLVDMTVGGVVLVVVSSDIVGSWFFFAPFGCYTIWLMDNICREMIPGYYFVPNLSYDDGRLDYYRWILGL